MYSFDKYLIKKKAELGIDMTQNDKQMKQTMISSTAKGASFGFDPTTKAIGAAVGLIAGGVTAGIRQRKQFDAIESNVNKASSITNPYQFAFGGKLSGSSRGYEYKGKSHAEGGININADGIPTNSSNAPVEVEGGEYNAKFGKTNYVFSNRLMLGGKVEYKHGGYLKKKLNNGGDLKDVDLKHSRNTLTNVKLTPPKNSDGNLIEKSIQTNKSVSALMLEDLEKNLYDNKVDSLYKDKSYKELSKFVKDDKTIPEIEESKDDYEDQRKWAKDYIKSPMYKKILTNEFTTSGKSKKEVDSEISKRYERVKRANIKEKQIHPKGYGYIRGMAYFTPDKNLIDEETGKRLVDMKDNDSSIPKEKPGTILLDPTAKYQDTSIATHEFDHISTRGTKDMTNYAIDKILDSTNKDEYRRQTRSTKTGRSFGYYDNPTEIKARLTELKYLMHKYNIYNPMKEKMNKDHLLKLMSNPHIKKKYDVKTLFETLEGKGDIIELMNTIAFFEGDDNKNNYA